MKIAVIGTGGMVGTAVMRFWNSPLVREKLAVSYRPVDELIPFDLPEFDAASRICTDSLIHLNPNVILNLSAINLPDWLESHPNTARTVHVQGAANLRHAASKTGALLVQLGCAEVFYENVDSVPKMETALPNPESIYAKTKLDAERAASEWERHLIVRTSALFGFPGSQGVGNLVDTVLKAVRRTDTIQVLSDTRVSLTFVLDLVRALRFLIHAGEQGLYHIAPSQIVTPAEAAQFVLDVCGLKRHRIEGISSEQYGNRAPRSLNTSLDSSKYHALPESYPIPAWQDAVREFLELRSQTPPLFK